MHRSNIHQFHVKYRVLIFPYKKKDFWSMRLKFLGSRELPGEGQRLVGVPRRSLRIFQAASARLQQTPRGSQEVAGGSLKDPSRLTGGSQELPGCSH